MSPWKALAGHGGEPLVGGKEDPLPLPNTGVLGGLRAAITRPAGNLFWCQSASMKLTLRAPRVTQGAAGATRTGDGEGCEDSDWSWNCQRRASDTGPEGRPLSPGAQEPGSGEPWNQATPSPRPPDLLEPTAGSVPCSRFLLASSAPGYS